MQSVSQQCFFKLNWQYAFLLYKCYICFVRNCFCNEQVVCIQTVCNGYDTMFAFNSSAEICRRKMWATKFSKKTRKILHANTDGESCFEDIFHPLITGIEARLSIFQSSNDLHIFAMCSSRKHLYFLYYFWADWFSSIRLNTLAA